MPLFEFVLRVDIKIPPFMLRVTLVTAEVYFVKLRYNVLATSSHETIINGITCNLLRIIIRTNEF